MGMPLLPIDELDASGMPACPVCGVEPGETCRVVNKQAQDWPQITQFKLRPRRMRRPHAERLAARERAKETTR